MGKLRVCVVGPTPETPGGVARSTLLLVYIYRKILGHDAVLIPYLRPSFRNLEQFKKCDVVHTQGPLDILSSLVLLILKNSKKILTLRGWVIHEAVVYFRQLTSVSRLRRFLVILHIFINWLIHKIILIPFVYDYVTAVSKITASKNGVRQAIIIKNPVLCKPKSNTLPIKRSFKDIRFITYISIGGGKIETILRAIAVVDMVNRILKKMGVSYRVKLEVYGKDLPDNFLYYLSMFDFVNYKGYVKNYMDKVDGADLFIAPYTFPELGHAVLEAICMGVPVAKFTEDPTEEEIIDMYNGILAKTIDEMVRKLIIYLKSIDKLKFYLYLNAKDTILQQRNIYVISLYWKSLLEN